MGQAPAVRGNTDLTQYDPERGLKSVAVAEAAEKHFARAKDADGLYEAIKAKLMAQRDFVLWWDAQEKDPGAIGKPGPGRGHKTP